MTDIENQLHLENIKTLYEMWEITKEEAIKEMREYVKNKSILINNQL